MCESKKPMTLKKTKLKYDECGLDYITIVDATVYKCSNCGSEIYDYGNLLKLNAVIRDLILKKTGLLAGNEVKFLRKHLGYSTETFARKLKVDKRTVQRWEKSGPKEPSIDRYIKLSVQFESPNRDYELHDYLNGVKEQRTFKRVNISTKRYEPVLMA